MVRRPAPLPAWNARFPGPCRLLHLPLLISIAVLLSISLPRPIPAQTDIPSPVSSAAEIGYPPFSSVDSQGRADGFSVELMRAALAAMGRSVTFRTGPWAEVREWLERGEVQALPLVGRTPEREALFDFTFSYLTLHGAIVVRKETEGIRRLNDLSGRRVGVMKGDNAEEFLRREERGIAIVTTPTYEDALSGLSRGDYDAVIVQRLVALRLLGANGFRDLMIVDHPVEGFRQDFSFAVNKGDSATLALLNEGLALTMADGTFRRLHAKWFAALELPSGRRILFGGDHNYPPFEFLDEDGHPAGFNVELTRAIALATGMDVEIRLGPWPAVRDGLALGEIDALGMVYSPERGKTFDFAPPHVVNNGVGVVRGSDGLPPATLQEFAQRRIVVQEGDIMHEFLLENGLEDRVSVVDSQETALRELAGGMHDCALVSRVTALYLIRKNGWKNLTIGSEPFLSPEYGYAVSKNQKALLAKFSEGLLLLENTGEYRRIHDKWMGVQENEGPGLGAVLRYSALITAPLLGLALLFFLWSWTLRRKVSQRTSDLRINEAKLKSIFDAAPIGIGLVADRVILDANDRLTEITGYAKEELVGQSARLLYPTQAEFEYVGTEKYRQLRERGTGTVETRFKRRDGIVIDVLMSSSPIDPSDLSAGVTFTAMDITDRKRSEEAAAQSENLMRYIIEHANSAVAVHDTELRYVYVSQRYLDEYRIREQEIIGKHHYEVFPDLPQKWRDVHQRALAGEVLSAERDSYQRADGTLEWTRWECRPWHEEDGSIGGIIVYTQVITEQVQAENALRESEERFSKAFQSNPGPMVISEIDTGRFIDVNEQWLKMLGHTREETIGSTSLELGIWADPEERERLVSLLRAQSSFTDAPIRFLSKSGAIRHALWSAESITLGGRKVMLSLILDITARTKAEEEREKLQSQLLQAQKMEAVGQLAGGVAHDFNNMLSVINGYAELLLNDLPPDAPYRQKIQEILKAGRQSADTVRQLLAFARKQTIDPQVLNLNEVTGDMLKMLRNLIGENIDLAWMPGHDLWKVKMDPVQLNQMLANLAINGRDAIADVGRVTIETANVIFDQEYCSMHQGFSPGEYVLMAVSDDGLGMDAKTQSRLFEPFFTTKEPGKGTGLGLATVYGIVKQNSGFINVYSEPGKGTTFRVYLPRHQSAPEEEGPRSTLDEIPGGGETVLLVEDKPMVLDLCTAMLENLGYEVLPAADQKEALRLAREHPGEIHLLLTDVIMPEMNGRDLRDQILPLRQGIKCLFMSGYTANVIAHHGVLDEDINFIEKPFTKNTLATQVRQALSGRRSTEE